MNWVYSSPRQIYKTLDQSSQSMRIIKFLGAFLAVFLIIAAIIVIPGWKSIKTIFENKNDLTEGAAWVQRISSDRGLVNYIQAHPQNVSVVSYDLSKPDSGIYYEADTLRPMGDLSTLLLAIEYARQVNEGLINPGARVALSKVARFDIPKVYNTYHTEALAELKRKKKIKNGTVSIDDLVRSALQSNDLAASDYLYFRLGAKNVREIPKILHLKTIEAPLPWSGLAVLWKPSLYHQTAEQRFDSLKKMPAEKYRNDAIADAQKLETDDAFYHKIQKSFDDNGLDILFSQERKFYELTPKGSPREMAKVLEKIVSDSLINPAVSRHIRKLLEQDVSGPMLNKLFNEYGGTFDSRMGLLNGADFGIAKRRSGTRVQVVIFDDLPVAVWFHLSSDFMNEDLQQKLIWDTSFYNFTKKRLDGKMD